MPRRLHLTPRLMYLSLFFLIGFMVAPPSQARISCDDEWVCVETVNTRRGVTLYVENLQPYPVTVSVMRRTRNLSTRLGRTITRTIDGGARIMLDRMTIIDDERDHSIRYWYDWTVGRQSVTHDDGYRYRLPYASGKRWPVLQGFNSSFSHTGLEEYAVDFRMPEGTPIHAAREGTVVKTEEAHNRGCWERGCGRFANYIVILHSDGTTGEYYHLQQHGVLVEVGDTVRRGQHIGYSGNTGHTTTPHLHFAVYKATSWGRTQSIPFVFDSARGTIRRPQRGWRYAPG